MIILLDALIWEVEDADTYFLYDGRNLIPLKEIKAKRELTHTWKESLQAFGPFIVAYFPVSKFSFWDENNGKVST